MPQKPDKPQHERDHGVVVAPSRPQTARPPLYSVLLLNDDYTPMDFVVDVLLRFFPLNLETPPRSCSTSTPAVVAYAAYSPARSQSPRWRR